MAGGVHQDQRSEHAGGAERGGRNRLLQHELNMANGVGIELRGRFLGQRVDVELVHHGFHLGLDPAVAMQRPIYAACHQGFVVHPGDGGAQLAAGGPGRRGGGCVAKVVFRRRCSGSGGGQNPVTARHIDFAVEDDAGARARGHLAWAAGMVQHLGHGGQLAARENLHRGTGRDVARSHAAPEHAAALRGVRRR